MSASVAVAEAIESLQLALDGFDARIVPVSLAPVLLGQFIEAEQLAASGRMLLTARAAESPQWKREGFASAADWLAAQRKVTPGRARQDLGTSQRLGELPETSEAVRGGALSPDQADIVADAASSNPEAERDLLKMAERDETLRRMREEGDRRKAEAEEQRSREERERKIRQRRSVTCRYRNGEGFISINGPQALIAEFEQRLNNEVGAMFRAKSEPSQREGRNAAAFDAFMKMTAGAGAAPESGSGSGSTSPRSMMLIRADLAALLRGELDDGEVCEIAGVGPISIAEARKLFGEATLGLILTNGPTVVDAINLGRRPTLRQQMALQWRDRCCTVAGCDRSVSIEFDHREEWAKGGATALDNIDPLCAFHHRLKTHQGYRLVDGAGRRPMRAPANQPSSASSSGRRRGSRTSSARSARSRPRVGTAPPTAPDPPPDERPSAQGDLLGA